MSTKRQVIGRVIDAIESMAPSTVYVETDEQGRARVVRLELAPREEGIQAEEAEAVADAVSRACAGLHPPPVLSQSASAAIERCVQTVRELVHVREEVVREALVDRIAHEGGVISTQLAADRCTARDHRAVDAWDRLRPALRQLLQEAS